MLISLIAQISLIKYGFNICEISVIGENLYETGGFSQTLGFLS
jgi:hypothetical protein